MVDIRDLAERIWNGEVSTQEVHPVGWRQPTGWTSWVETSPFQMRSARSRMSTMGSSVRNC